MCVYIGMYKIDGAIGVSSSYEKLLAVKPHH